MQAMEEQMALFQQILAKIALWKQRQLLFSSPEKNWYSSSLLI